MIAEAKSDYESSLASNYAHMNNNKIFQFISSIKGRESFPAKMCYNDEYASTDLDKAQLFNKYLYSVFSSSTNTTANIPDSQLNKQTITNNQTNSDIYFSDSDIFELLTSLDVGKAYGIDNLSPIIFKHCAVPLLQIICHLFHTSISTSIIPCDWRTHCIVPIYKSGDKSSVSNYRPISLSCILSKVLEK